MKVTALIPDQLVLEKIKKLNKEISAHPLEFHEGYSAASIRKLNRRR